MSVENKAKGGIVSELRKLKDLAPAKQEVIWSWRDERDGEGKGLTNPQIRNRIATQFAIRLEHDSQLSQFWSWYQHRQVGQRTNDLMDNFEELIRKANPDWSDEKVRSVGTNFFLAQSVAREDPDQFATIMTLDQRERFGRTTANQKERELNLKEQKFIVDADVYFETLLKRAGELNASNLSHADKIAEMRKAAFQSVDELQASGQVVIPKA